MKRKGGRPKGDPAALRVMTIGVRVSLDEYAALRQKAAQMSMTPAQWLREAALSRRLPSPPVPPVNRERYAELARLAANLNQIAHRANAGYAVTVADVFLRQLMEEVSRLRLALIGKEQWEGLTSWLKERVFSERWNTSGQKKRAVSLTQIWLVTLRANWPLNLVRFASCARSWARLFYTFPCPLP